MKSLIPSPDETAATTMLLNAMEESVISYCIRQIKLLYAVRWIGILVLVVGGVAAFGAQSSDEKQGLQIMVNQADGTYTIAMPGSKSYALRAGVGAEVDRRWLHA